MSAIDPGDLTVFVNAAISAGLVRKTERTATIERLRTRTLGEVRAYIAGLHAAPRRPKPGALVREDVWLEAHASGARVQLAPASEGRALAEAVASMLRKIDPARAY